MRVLILVMCLILMCSGLANAGIIGSIIAGSMISGGAQAAGEKIEEGLSANNNFTPVVGKRFVLLNIKDKKDSYDHEYLEYFWMEKDTGETHDLRVEKIREIRTRWNEPRKFEKNPTPDIIKEVLKDVYGEK